MYGRDPTLSRQPEPRCACGCDEPLDIFWRYVGNDPMRSDCARDAERQAEEEREEQAEREQVLA